MQKHVAIKAGLDPSYLAALERGKRPPPKPSVIDNLLDALDATTSDRREIREAAAVDRILLTLEITGGDIRGGHALNSMLHALPNLTDSQIDAIAALVDSIGSAPQREALGS